MRDINQVVTWHEMRQVISNVLSFNDSKCLDNENERAFVTQRIIEGLHDYYIDSETGDKP